MSFMSCRDNAFRASLAEDGRLSLAGRIALGIHLVLCAPCRLYRAQIRALAALVRKRAKKHPGEFDPSGPMGADARERLRRRLKDHQD